MFPWSVIAMAFCPMAYIGLGLAIAQAAELKVDSTPMEGFIGEELDELLELKSKGLKSVLLLPSRLS